MTLHAPPVRGDLHDQVVVVTGAARGIGAAVARGCHGAGAVVVGVDLDEPEGDCPWQSHRVDVTAASAIARLVDALRDEHGLLHCLVNNAGVSRRSSLRDLDDATWHVVHAVNLRAPIMLARAVLPLLVDGASIVNVSSIRARRGFPDDVAYLAAKGGLDAATRGLAVELAPRIRVNAVAPGAVETDLNSASLTDPSTRARVVGRIPLGRLGTPADVAGAVVYLASPAASFITGTVLVVDGGQSAAG